MRDGHLSCHTHPIPSRPPTGGPSPSRVSTGRRTPSARGRDPPNRGRASPPAGGHPIWIFTSPTFSSTGTLNAFPTTSEPFGLRNPFGKTQNPSLCISCNNVGGKVEGDPEPCPPTWPRALNSSWIAFIRGYTSRAQRTLLHRWAGKTLIPTKIHLPDIFR